MNLQMVVLNEIECTDWYEIVCALASQKISEGERAISNFKQDSISNFISSTTNFYKSNVFCLGIVFQVMYIYIYIYMYNI